MTSGRKTLGACVATAALIVAVGCGSDEETSTTAAGGATAASPSGGSIQVEKKKIGVLDIAGPSSPISMATRNTILAGCEALGWECPTADGEGNPETQARAMNAFATQGVDAVIMASVEPQVVQAGLNRLKAADAPVIGVNAQVTPSDLIAAQYTENEKELARGLAEHIVETVPDAKIGDIKSTLGISGTDREEALQEVVSASDGAEIVGSVEPDFASLVPSTTKGVTDMLTANPDINAMWSVYDNFLQPATAAMRSKGTDAKLYTFYLTPTSYEMLEKDSALEAVQSVNLAKTGAIALDQLVHHFETGDPLDPDAVEKDPLTYEVITRDNLPSSPQGANDPEQIIAPFVEKWQKEYGG